MISGSVTNLMNQKKPEKYRKDDCTKFWNLFASQPEWREVQIQKANRE
jgi:hypothetical protein